MYTNGHLESDINIDFKNLPYRTRVDDSSGKNKDLYGKMYNASMDEDKNNFDLSPVKNTKIENGYILVKNTHDIRRNPLHPERNFEENLSATQTK